MGGSKQSGLVTNAKMYICEGVSEILCIRNNDMLCGVGQNTQLQAKMRGKRLATYCGLDGAFEYFMTSDANAKDMAWHT